MSGRRWSRAPAREDLGGNIQDKKVIKLKIRNWRADFLRV